MSRHVSGKGITLAGCALVCAALLVRPQLSVQGFEAGVQLCLHTILPALFPFFVICELLAGIRLRGVFLQRMARLAGLQSEESAAALLLAWIGGYAVCAQLVERLRRSVAISARDASLVLLLGCCSSPGFVIGCVGGLLLGNPQLGIILYTAQISANLLSTALCLPLLPQRARSSDVSGRCAPAETVTFPKALSSATTSCLQVCSCVLFFRILTAHCVSYLPHLPLLSSFLSGLCEISAGCFDFAALGGRAALYGCCLCMSLLGFSVWMQLSVLLQGTVSLRPLLCSRLLHLWIFPLLVWLCARCLPGSCTVYRTLADRVITTQRIPPDAACIAFLFLCSVLYKIRQNFYNE